MPQVTLADAILALGNEICVNSYKKYSNAPIYPIPGLFYRTQDAYKILQDRNMSNSKTNFLWFGSSGLVRKGLDLALEVFYRRADLTLHICGPIKNEPDFEKVYFKELYQTENIITYGFVDITSDVFAKILKTCAFVIFPSCMEGGSPSTLTAIGNGALIPIITKETTISTGNEIWIEDFTPEAVEEAVNKALSLGEDEIIKMQKENLEYVLKHNSQENYYRELKKAIEEILGYKK
jgi:glycosyltransferase involved in cell wall biosynthesis